MGIVRKGSQAGMNGEEIIADANGNHASNGEERRYRAGDFVEFIGGVVGGFHVVGIVRMGWDGQGKK